LPSYRGPYYGKLTKGHPGKGLVTNRMRVLH
jgi:hypothetical protein